MLHTPPPAPPTSPTPTTAAPTSTPSTSARFPFVLPVLSRIHSNCRPLVTTIIVVIAFTFVIILVVIAAIIGLVMRIVAITIEFAIRMENITAELQAIIKSYYYLNFRGSWGRILSFI